ncbi:hypothetical protein I601_1963 [Nocardioides dokdonensis FR1436]|uniref:DUF8017 domain-containing protein n=1 Tax=Nocardioides dokdonensis FR1436 TaxID=1300347 RepID=A0A1A9GL58_9ACTN|nr:hypothetical protein [Nocardioides dokdonensis]ANH38392.1 hypothetical protein I601_1963 [Nocardioides dokdonensis FR1436]
MGTRADRLPWPLVALAVLTSALVLVTGGVVVAGWVARPGDGPAGPTAGEATAGTPVVRDLGPGAAAFDFSGDWSLRPPGTSVFYTDAEGRISAALDGAAVYRDGFCDRAGAAHRPSNRAVAGFGRVSRLGARRTSRAVAQQWRAAIAFDSRTGTVHETSRVRTRDVELADGAAAVRSDFTLRIAEPSACEAARVRTSVVSLDTGGWTASLVLVRDVAVPDALGDAEAERLLASLRPA